MPVILSHRTCHCQANRACLAINGSQFFASGFRCRIHYLNSEAGWASFREPLNSKLHLFWRFTRSPPRQIKTLILLLVLRVLRLVRNPGRAVFLSFFGKTVSEQVQITWLA